MAVFNSVIVFDAETTSLPHLDYNTTKIIELAFLGCEVKHLESSKELPRALHKLVLLFNPNKMIRPDATRVSGLDNELLKNVKSFGKEEADMLRTFISRLPPPVCIVAHNGERFDFPILRKHLDDLHVELGNNVYCADSLKIFRKIYPKSKEASSSSSSSKGLSVQNKIGAKYPTTPPNQKTIPINSLFYKGEGCAVKRELFPDHDKMEHWVGTQSVPKCLSSPNSYKLSDIYMFLHGKNLENAHRAENDAYALMSCIVQSKMFLSWIGSYSAIFDTLPPLF